MTKKHRRKGDAHVALLREVSLKPANAEVLAQDETSIQRDKLIDQARDLLSRAFKGGLAAGRAYNELRPFFQHGDWVPFLKAEADRAGLSFRTLQEYMRMAHERDALLKKEKSAKALFEDSNDPQAQAIRKGNKAAKANRAQTDIKKTNRQRKAGIYRLPLSLTGQQKFYVDALRNLPNWADAQLAIITKLEELFVLYGVVNDLEEPEIHPERELDTTATFKQLEANPNPGTATDAAQI